MKSFLDKFVFDFLFCVGLLIGTLVVLLKCLGVVVLCAGFGYLLGGAVGWALGTRAWLAAERCGLVPVVPVVLVTYYQGVWKKLSALRVARAVADLS